MSLRVLFTALVVVTAFVLWVAAGTASATVLISEAGVHTGSLIAESEGHVVLDNPVGKIECASKVEGKVESHGEAVTAGGNISNLAFTSCTSGWHVTVVSPGSLEVHWTSGANGTITSSGATVGATVGGIACNYKTNSTDLGTLTGGSPATLDINASIPFHNGSIFCGTSNTLWTGSYKITSPEELFVVQNADLPNFDLTVPPESFPEGVEVQVELIDQISKMEYTVEKVIVKSIKGKWEAFEVANCENQKVPIQKEAGHVICKMKVKCLAKGDEAKIEVPSIWATGKVNYAYKAACL